LLASSPANGLITIGSLHSVDTRVAESAGEPRVATAFSWKRAIALLTSRQTESLTERGASNVNIHTAQSKQAREIGGIALGVKDWIIQGGSVVGNEGIRRISIPAIEKVAVLR